MPTHSLLQTPHLDLVAATLDHLEAELKDRAVLESLLGVRKKESIHVIAGGGGAFLHGTRISRGPGTAPPECVYPNKKESLRLALGMPPRLAAGTAGFLPHYLFALLAALTLILGRGPVSRALVVVAITVF